MSDFEVIVGLTAIKTAECWYLASGGYLTCSYGKDGRRYNFSFNGFAVSETEYDRVLDCAGCSGYIEQLCLGRETGVLQ